MKTKPVLMAGIVTFAYLLILTTLYGIHQGKKQHLNAREAESFAYQLIDSKCDSTPCFLINQRTAVKIADQLFSEKYGSLKTELIKPFDIFLFNDYWFIYGPVSKSGNDEGPMIIINRHTGASRVKV